MPEILSAKDFSQIMEDCIAFDNKEFCGYNSKQCRNAIRSRDSAMLEKYKEAIVRQWCRNTGQNELLNDAMISADLQALVYCLDAVYMEANGGKPLLMNGNQKLGGEIGTAFAEIEGGK